VPPQPPLSPVRHTMTLPGPPRPSPGPQTMTAGQPRPVRITPVSTQTSPMRALPVSAPSNSLPGPSPDPTATPVVRTSSGRQVRLPPKLQDFVLK
jgi:hypothetical protein